MDMRRLISPRSQMEIARENAALVTFQDLKPDLMAATLLEASRTLIDSGRFSPDPCWSYDERALYRIIPEIARRLDLDVDLRDSEIPKDAERHDRVTWIHGEGLGKLVSAIQGIIGHGSFSRASQLNGADAETAAAMKFLFTSSPNAFELAAGAISPQDFPARAREDKRAPLEGFYVLDHAETYDKVLKYTEDRAEADRFFDAAVLLHAATVDCPEELLDAKNEIHRSRFHVDAEQVLLQTGRGETLRSHDLRAFSEPEMEL